MDDQRRHLAAKAKVLGWKVLRELETVVRRTCLLAVRLTNRAIEVEDPLLDRLSLVNAIDPFAR